jgi:UDP-N-acetylmuramoyl-tripeptide--D-alanyl-D-alanine ligase
LKKKSEVLYEGKISLTGKHQAGNLAACAAVLDTLDISPDIYSSALGTLQLPGMRMKVTERNEITWVNDAYNANPQSTAAFINWLAGLKLTNRIFLVLGDMLELGEKSAAFHLQIAKAVPSDWSVIAVGEYYSAAFGDSARCYTDSSAAVEALELLPGDIIALKGSRGMELELIQKYFEEKE